MGPRRTGPKCGGAVWPCRDRRQTVSDQKSSRRDPHSAHFAANQTATRLIARCVERLRNGQYFSLRGLLGPCRDCRENGQCSRAAPKWSVLPLRGLLGPCRNRRQNGQCSRAAPKWSVLPLRGLLGPCRDRRQNGQCSPWPATLCDDQWPLTGPRIVEAADSLWRAGGRSLPLTQLV
jgi:hypothetical protein